VLDEKIVYVQQKIAEHKHVPRRTEAVGKRFTRILLSRRHLLAVLLEERENLIRKQLRLEIAKHKATVEAMSSLLSKYQGQFRSPSSDVDR
jgi:hypothetical protein